MVPLDLSADSEGVVVYAERLAKTWAAELCLIHVVHYRKMNMNYAIAFPGGEGDDLKAAAARRRLKALAKGRHEHVVVRRGPDPASSIVDAAVRLKADLILMDGAAHRSFRHLARGRWRCLVSQVSRVSPIPVLLAKLSA